MKFYISDLSIIILAIFYLPLVFLVLIKIIRSGMNASKKFSMIFIAMLVAYVIPLGDVTMNSFAMKEACKESGLHAYKKVEVDGYLDRSGHPGILKEYPNRSIESNGPYRFGERLKEG